MSSSGPASVYFVGIGGIGMSALARYYRARGVRVGGYDLRASELTRELEAAGCEIVYADDPASVPADVDLAVYTPAVPEDLGILRELDRRGVKRVKRARALGIISGRHRTLAVAGTHGKTTTSTLAAYLMHEAGTGAVAFLGGISADYGSNYVAGDGKWMVTEADEYDRSFLHLGPHITVITYIEPDHLDIYGDAADFERGFRDYVGCVQPGGTVVTKPHIAAKLSRELERLRVLTYGTENDDEGEGDAGTYDYTARAIRVEGGCFVFDLAHPDGVLEGLRLAVPGRHNVENAVAALAACAATGELSLEAAAALLPSFRGVRRRFEMLGEWRGARVISDYAHHPTEVRAAIGAARELFCSYRVIGIFQPHLYSRTRDFAPEFGEALSDLQEVVLLPLYPARERPIEGVTSITILDHVSAPNRYLVDASNATALLEVLAGDVLLFMGAGDIDEFARTLVTTG